MERSVLGLRKMDSQPMPIPGLSSTSMPCHQMIASPPCMPRRPPHLASLNVGYTNETGFGNQDGTAFALPFYFGDNKCRVKINGKQNLSYTFANFVLWDTTVDTFFGNWGWPVLIRLGASDPLRITIPMDSYEPSKHKNIARLRVKFNDHEKPQHFRYEVIFEDFVAR